MDWNLSLPQVATHLGLIQRFSPQTNSYLEAVPGCRCFPMRRIEIEYKNELRDGRRMRAVEEVIKESKSKIYIVYESSDYNGVYPQTGIFALDVQ
ncbi:hypothetical protein CDAR_588421 [Caerostris darwini]|uniref:Uncharacterized protein n=1 Tax=Caerostris darwini TaxID=1538125 RepID=A0AAV4WAF2_9ARAC|nr:hypothetical protein CDAR_588421 [Caerostris darwini]